MEEDVVDFVIRSARPYTCSADMIMITTASIALYAMQRRVRRFPLFVPFIFLLSVTMIAAPAFPGEGP